jgi:hypothetical protein
MNAQVLAAIVSDSPVFAKLAETYLLGRSST